MKRPSPILTCLLAATLAFSCHAPQSFDLAARPALEAELPVTVVLVRHAETAGSTNVERDPALSDAGEARAEALARLLGETRVTHVFATEFQRTQATVAPLAAALELETQVMGAGEGDQLSETLRQLPPGSIAVLAGHSNTVPGIVKSLGGEPRNLVDHPRYGGMLGHDQYDRLFLVTLPADDEDPTQTIELRYGS